MEKIATAYFFSFLTLFSFIFLCFLIYTVKKRKDLADTFWGIGFIVVAWTGFIFSGFSYIGLVVNSLVTLWAIRLTIHIFLRNRKRDEDFRYEKWKGNRQVFFKVFILQGIILFIVALPIIWIQLHPISEIPLLPILIWSIGFLLEAVSDYQLLVFKNDKGNNGKLLISGLWGYVRHPNYLGEILQWWAIWMISSYLPYGFLLIISPLLITALIIWISGIKPLEDKMKGNPDFIEYAKKTPSLIPFSLVNGLLYSLTWYFVVKYGAKGAFATALIIGGAFYLSQILFFSKYNRKLFLICIPLSILSLILGSIQEIIFINTNVLIYPNHINFPPLWLLILYPIFSLTLNSSLSFLNKKLYLPFLLGGIGANLSYLCGEKLNGVILTNSWSYLVIFISWGILLTLITYFNSKLIALEQNLTSPESLQKPITVFFDISCPICAKEMHHLKKRKQTGLIYYATPCSNTELKKITTAFTYKESMKSIHGLTHDGQILKGIDTLSNVYARTDLPLLAIILQTPLFYTFFRGIYWIWLKIR